MHDHWVENNFIKLLDSLRTAPQYQKENVLCYFYYNTSNCQDCPYKENCKQKSLQNQK